MSDSTNTPNGDSKNLYIQNIDTGKFETNFFALEERNPEKDNNSDSNPGSNTVVKPVEIGQLDNEGIKRVGYVGIPVQPLTLSKKNQIEQKALASKHAKEAEAAKNKDESDERNV